MKSFLEALEPRKLFCVVLPEGRVDELSSLPADAVEGTAVETTAPETSEVAISCGLEPTSYQISSVELTDGSSAVLEWASDGGQWSFQVSKFLPGGELDASFGKGGTLRLSVEATVTVDEVTGNQTTVSYGYSQIFVDAEGRILLQGWRSEVVSSLQKMPVFEWIPDAVDGSEVSILPEDGITDATLPTDEELAITDEEAAITDEELAIDDGTWVDEGFVDAVEVVDGESTDEWWMDESWGDASWSDATIDDSATTDDAVKSDAVDSSVFETGAIETDVPVELVEDPVLISDKFAWRGGWNLSVGGYQEAWMPIQSSFDFVVVRLATDGTPDASYGQDGVAKLDPVSLQTWMPLSYKLDEAGGVSAVLAGPEGESFAITRVDEFGVVTPTTGEWPAWALAAPTPIFCDFTIDMVQRTAAMGGESAPVSEGTSKIEEPAVEAVAVVTPEVAELRGVFAAAAQVGSDGVWSDGQSDVFGSDADGLLK
jgi:hypothetical protein